MRVSSQVVRDGVRSLCRVRRARSGVVTVAVLGGVNGVAFAPMAVFRSSVFSVSVGRGEDDYSLAGVELKVGAGGMYLATLGHRHHDGVGRPLDVGNAAPLSREVEQRFPPGARLDQSM